VATTDRGSSTPRSEVARAEGLEVGATCAAWRLGAFALAESGSSVPTTRSSLLNTGAGNKDVDALRAHLGEGG